MKQEKNALVAGLVVPTPVTAPVHTPVQRPVKETGEGDKSALFVVPDSPSLYPWLLLTAIVNPEEQLPRD